jgi:hypothetical protein
MEFISHKTQPKVQGETASSTPSPAPKIPRRPHHQDTAIRFP